MVIIKTVPLILKIKKIACEKVGVTCNVLNYPDSITESALIKIINDLNNNSNIDAILVQLPLQRHINSEKVINTITTKKDVDGFTLEILGNLMLVHYNLLPRTPKGIIALLKNYQIQLAGQHVVIISRSNIVDKPLANLLINASATVTVCHSQTKNLSVFTKQADILISAVGKDKFVTAEMIKENAIVVDVEINSVGLMTIATLLENILYLYQLNQEI